MDPKVFEQLVAAQWQAVPEEFRQQVENLSLQVEAQADPEILDEMGYQHPDDLLGLYQGWPLPERGSGYGQCLPDVISLFQSAIERHAEREGLDLDRVIRETIVHELGHYFGFSEHEMDYFENLWAESADKNTGP